jgi:hypothetical protein
MGVVATDGKGDETHVADTALKRAELWRHYL